MEASRMLDILSIMPTKKREIIMIFKAIDLVRPVGRKNRKIEDFGLESTRILERKFPSSVSAVHVMGYVQDCASYVGC